MTTTVKVEAHCGENFQVLVEAIDKNQPVGAKKPAGSQMILQSGEQNTFYVTGTRSISVSEVPKPPAAA